MAVPFFKAFRSTVTPPQERLLSPPDKLLVHPVTGAPIGLLNSSANGADARFTPVDLTAAQIASPTAAMLADLDAIYRLDEAPYTRYISNGTALVSLDQSLKAQSVTIRAPLPADVEAVVAADTPADGALTIAAQPVHARKLQVDIVIGTSPDTKITAGTVTIVGQDQDGNAISQEISLVTDDSTNIVTDNAFGLVDSATIADYAADGSGTGNTISIGVTDDFGLPVGQGTIAGFNLVKVTKTTTDYTGGTVVSADDDASSATVDAAARTVSPTTSPDADGLIDFQFIYAGAVTG